MVCILLSCSQLGQGAGSVLVNGDGDLESSGRGGDGAGNLVDGLVLGASGGGGGGAEIIGVGDDPTGDAFSTAISTNTKDITSKVLTTGPASAGVSNPGGDLMSGGDSGDPDDVTYPAFGP